MRVCVRMCVCVYACMCVDMCICMCVCVYAFVPLCVRVYGWISVRENWSQMKNLTQSHIETHEDHDTRLILGCLTRFPMIIQQLSCKKMVLKMQRCRADVVAAAADADLLTKNLVLARVTHAPPVTWQLHGI